MRHRLLLTACLAAAFAVAGCQSYEMDPVKPRAISLVNEPIPIMGVRKPPKVMLVVDKSGSMMEASPGEPFEYCTNDGKLEETSTYQRGKADCKWTQLLDVFNDTTNGFLYKSQSKARFGLMTYANDSGYATGSVKVAISDGAGTNVPSIVSTLNATSPGGGTPTAASLTALLGNEPFMREEAATERLVMLLTDGVPNGNGDLVQRCQDCFASCAPDVNSVCTGTAALCYGPGRCYPSNAVRDHECKLYGDAATNCWDGEGLLSAVQALRTRGVRTFVIGFGDATAAPDAVAMMDNAAVAGGFERSGSPKFYQASNQVELQAALDKFSESFQSCTFTLSPPPGNPDLFQVVLTDTQSGDKTTLTRDAEWTFTSNEYTAVQIQDVVGGALRCQQLQNAQPERYSITFLYAASM